MISPDLLDDLDRIARAVFTSFFFYLFFFYLFFSFSIVLTLS